MMKIEKKFATMELQQFKQKPYDLLVKEMYKHQNFNFKSALERINRGSMSYNSAKSMFGLMNAYLRYGTRHKNYNKLYDVVDKLKVQHCAILTPAEHEKSKRQYGHRRQSANSSPTTDVVAPNVEPPKYTEIIPDQFGVKLKNTIKLFPNKDACEAYIECYKEFAQDTRQVIELVKIEYEVV